MKQIEQLTETSFGDSSNPLLVSVRSGARASMPGMMDTVLNLGMNDTVVEGIAKRQVMNVLPGIHIVDLFKCMEMLFWE